MFRIRMFFVFHFVLLYFYLVDIRGKIKQHENTLEKSAQLVKSLGFSQFTLKQFHGTFSYFLFLKSDIFFFSPANCPNFGIFSHCIWVLKRSSSPLSVCQSLASQSQQQYILYSALLSINIGLQRLRTQNCLNGHFGTLLTSVESRKRSRKYLAEMVITISMTAQRGSKSSFYKLIGK